MLIAVIEAYRKKLTAYQDAVNEIEGERIRLQQMYDERSGRKKLTVGAKAIWTPSTYAGGPYTVEIVAMDHGRAYCMLAGVRHGDYEDQFEVIAEAAE